jgi:hypothetical protein
MTIRGINQELAAAIVEYRDRRGDYFSLDDIQKVGIIFIIILCRNVIHIKNYISSFYNDLLYLFSSK